MKKQLLYLLTLAFLLSCAGDEFAANKSQNTYSVSSALEYEKKMCAQYSLIKPEVDILVLWDNSSSSFAMKQENLNAIKSLVTGITDNRFNFRILNMPLLGTAAPILIKSPNSEDRAGYSVPSTGVYSNIVKVDNPVNINAAINMINFPVMNTGGAESGIEQSIDSINKYDKIFRKNANTFVMVVSNGDDQECDRLAPGHSSCEPADIDAFIATKRQRILCLRGNTNQSLSHCSSAGLTNKLDARMFRFISVIPTTKSCQGFNVYRSSAYGKMSKAMYTEVYASNSYNDPTTNADVYNLCGNSSTFINGILASLESVIDYHIYDFWPVAPAGQQLDLASIRVYKNGALLQDRTHDTNPSSGYKLLLNPAGDDLTVFTNKNTRAQPTPGEPYSGKMLQLFGPDRVLLGSCLSVYYTDKKNVIGFIYLKAGKPSLDKMTVKMTIGGHSYTVPQSYTEGWEYINPIQVGQLSANNPDLAIVDRPANDSIIGHFIKLNGSYKIKNDQNVTFQVDYIPASNYGN